MSGYTDAFSNDLLPPSDLGLSVVSLTGTTQAEWPGNYNGTGIPLPKILEVSCGPGAILKLPPANQVSPGNPVLIRNYGANTLSVQNYAGAGLVSIATGIAQFLYVIDNATAAGTWGQITYGAGGSSIASGALAGYGTKATGPTLSVASPVYSVSSDTTLTTAMRGQTIEFTGGAANLNLSLAATYGNDFYCMVKNSGTGSVGIVPSGAEASDVLSLQPTESFTLVCTGTEWITIGYGRSLLYQTSALALDVTAGGIFTLSAAQASNKLITFIGAPAADVTVIVPSALSVYYTANNLTTAHTVFVKTSAGSPMAIHQNIRAILVCDGLEVTEAQSQVVVNMQSIPDGTEAVPAINFYSATGTGFYKFGATGFGISVGGDAQLEASPTGVNFPHSISIAGIPVTGSALPRSARTSNTIIGDADRSTLIDITSGTFTQTFVAVATLGAGWWCYIRNSGTGDITLDPNLSETIDGATTSLLSPGMVIIVQCDGSALRSVVLAEGGSLYFCAREEQASGTDGGACAATTWQTRTLNTVTKNTIVGASLASNNITLPAGTYRIEARYPTAGLMNHKGAIYNNTDSAFSILGDVSASKTHGIISGNILITAQKTFSLRQFSSAADGQGFGTGLASAGQTEVFATVEIWRLA